MNKILRLVGGLVGKVPLEKLLAWALKLGLLRKPLELAAQGWTKAQGLRTQGAGVLAAILALAASLDWIPWEIATPAIQALAGLAGAAFLDKLNRVLPQVQAASEAIKSEAEKPKE